MSSGGREMFVVDETIISRAWDLGNHFFKISSTSATHSGTGSTVPWNFSLSSRAFSLFIFSSSFATLGKLLHRAKKHQVGSLASRFPSQQLVYKQEFYQISGGLATNGIFWRRFLQTSPNTRAWDMKGNVTTTEAVMPDSASFTSTVGLLLSSIMLAIISKLASFGNHSLLLVNPIKEIHLPRLLFLFFFSIFLSVII